MWQLTQSFFWAHSVMISVGQTELSALYGKATSGGTTESSGLSSPAEKSNLSLSRHSELGASQGTTC